MSKELAAANRYLNLLPQPERGFGLAYLAWIKGGAMGVAPERGRLSARCATQVIASMGEFLGPDPFTAVRS